MINIAIRRNIYIGLALMFMLFPAVLFGQVLTFSFGNYENTLEIPVDTQWRKYDIPMDLLIPNDLPYEGEARFTLRKPIGYGEPDSCIYWLDRLHFPSNSLEMFDDTSAVNLTLYPGQGNTLDYSYSTDTPDTSEFSLSFRCDSQTELLLFDIWIADPLNGEPEIPEVVSFYIKAQNSANLQKFIPLNVGNMWQWDNLYSGGFRISEIVSAVANDCTVTYATNEWEVLDNEATISHKLYEIDINYPGRVTEITLGYNFGRTIWDFSLLPGEYLPDEPMYPEEESFSSVLGVDVFTKKFQPQMYLDYSYQKFAYGIGKSEDYLNALGDEIIESLVWAKIDTQYYGDFRFQNTVSFWVDTDTLQEDMDQGIKTFPDTSWIHYSVPLSELNLPFDSTGYVQPWVFIIRPAFYQWDVTGGWGVYRELMVDDIEIRYHNGDPPFVIDTFDNGIDNWSTLFLLDGSGIGLQSSTDTPTGEGSSLYIVFGNSMDFQFSGYAYTYWDSTNAPQFHLGDTLSIWVKDLGQYGSVDDKPHPFPERFALHQNYPNPFNATTTIRFDLPEAVDVELVIYDILGREVEELVSGQLAGGEHEVVWNAANMASGVYFYQLETPSGKFTRKLVVLK